ncbi:MAG TPA: winged helix-turn-helix domain-containing protein [Caulobacteraceae bacterium]|jgi:TolB-like protein
MSAQASNLPVDLAREPAFRLARVDVRPATREVFAAGLRQVLEPRVMQVLVALARRRGEVVSRDELIDACWRGRIVGDDALNRCIASLRRLAAAWGGLVIETVARVGYRLDEVAASRAEGSAAVVLLVVLPFDSLSDESELAHFSEGVTQEILLAVAGGTAMKVIGGVSSFRFRGPSKVVRHIVDDLNATHVLDGSVRRCGQRVRVAAHLIECEGQTILWTGRFDRELADVFESQDTVAEAIASQLSHVLHLDA